MRNGRLLVEDSPTALLQKFDCDVLNKVVLKLCRLDESLLKTIDSSLTHVSKTTQRSSVEVKKGQTSKSKNSYNVFDEFSKHYLQLAAVRRASIQLEKCSREKSLHQSLIDAMRRIHGLSVVMWLTLYRHPV